MSYQEEQDKLIPGDLTLFKKSQELWKAYSTAFSQVETYRAEVDRGLIHTDDWKRAMANIITTLSIMRRKAEEASDTWKKTIPPYDPDDHVGSCGCVVKNGKRVKWCGDHY